MVPLLDSALALADLVRRRALSPVELVDACLARIEALNPQLNAFVGLDADTARCAARRAEGLVLSGAPLGVLHGVPISVKSAVAVVRAAVGDRLAVSRRRSRRDRCAARDASARSRRHRHRCHERGRAADGVGNRQRAVRAHQQSVGARSDTGRIQRRRGGRDRRRPLGGRHRQRRRRVDSRAGAFQRDLWPQADPWSGARDGPSSNVRRSICADRGRRPDGSDH